MFCVVKKINEKKIRKRRQLDTVAMTGNLKYTICHNIQLAYHAKTKD